MNPAFIVGSPRSGTTILENILNCHPEIAEWYEPYYLWGKYFSVENDDIWREDKLIQEIRQAIRREFNIFAEKAKKSVVLDKSPDNSYNIGIIYKIFPEAKWIHILRDGRDVTLSIRKEWEKRSKLVSEKNFGLLIKTAVNMLRRQNFWRYRIMAIMYELRSQSTLNPFAYLNKSKWAGMAAWGPRFKGWREYYENKSILEFNAMQWKTCVEAVRKVWPILPDENKVEIRYEDLLTNPEYNLRKIFDVLGLEVSHDFFKSTPKLMKGNFNKWSKEFTKDDINMIKPILANLISDLNYNHTNQW